jgi:transposase-like protein
VAVCLPAIDQFGQVIDVFVSQRRDAVAAWRFFDHAIGSTTVMPGEVVTDRVAVYPRLLDELAAAARHRAERRYANNRIEADHRQLKRRLRPIRGLNANVGARIVTAGRAFVQNLRHGHHKLAVDQPAQRRVAAALDELAAAI